MLTHMIRETEGAASPTVKLTDRTVFNSRPSGICYAGIKVDADGVLYQQQANGGWSAIGSQWLVSGTAASFYVSRTIISGTLTTDAGAGTLQLNTDRIYDIQQASAGLKSASILMDISSDVSGSPIVASATFSLRAEQGSL